jgi:hypothetical protein
MKQGSFRAVRLVIFLLVMFSLAAVSTFGDENVVDYLSVILEPFNGETSHEWSYGGRTYSYDFEWALDASKFATNINNNPFPKLTYVPSWPMALFGTNREGRDIKSIGIWGRFDRRGYNWVDLYPIKVGSADSEDGPEPFEIPIPGRLNYLDLWVWGSNLNFYLEAYFRDYQGVVYTINMGDLYYTGWKNLRVRIPTNIPQSKRVLPRLAGLTFVKFRIWTTPGERVDNFYVYFNQMKILTDIFETLYDGDELGDPDQVRKLWAQN